MSKLHRVGRLSCAGAACLVAALASGCEDTDESVHSQVVAPSGADSGRLDAGVDERGVIDAALDAARVDASKTCYSPLSPPVSMDARGSANKGCACVHTESTNYCINSLVVICSEDSRAWQAGLDGYCFPTRRPDPVGSCQQLQGTEIARGTKCPSGFALRYGHYRYSTEDAGVGEYDDCCYPIEVPAMNCTQAGLTVSPTGTESRLLATTCSNGGALRAFVVGQPSPSLCCASADGGSE